MIKEMSLTQLEELRKEYSAPNKCLICVDKDGGETHIALAGNANEMQDALEILFITSPIFRTIAELALNETKGF